MCPREASERDEVISLLVLEAGAIFEDLATQLAFSLPTEEDAKAATLARLARHGDDGAVLLRAAQILDGRKGAEA